MPAPTPIPIYVDPFQSGYTGNIPIVSRVGTPNGATGGCAIGCTGYMQFINEGYTALFITTSTTGVNCTLYATPDNAGRVVNVVKYCPKAQTTMLGPLRPIWWNYGGVVQVGLKGGRAGTAGVTGAVISAVQQQF